MNIDVYTDGSATTFDKPGGWAFVIVVDGVKAHEGSGSLVKATNNMAELTAGIEGLTYVSKEPKYAGATVTLVSDSNLVLHFADGQWKCKEMRLAVLCAMIKTLYNKLGATTRWVKGHSGDEHNETCDVLAKAARKAEAAKQTLEKKNDVLVNNTWHDKPGISGESHPKKDACE